MMYVAISTDNQTGSRLGRVRCQCNSLLEAWEKARKLNSKQARGVVRKVITGGVESGEDVGFFDPRLGVEFEVKKGRAVK